MKSKKRGLKKAKLTSKKKHLTSLQKNSSSLNKSRKKLFIFLVKFFVIFGIANVLIELINLAPLTNLIAKITGGFLGLAVQGTTVFAGAQAFLITNSCTGLVSASILGAIIFSLKKPELKIKLALFIWGTIALLLVNIPRVMLVLLAAQSGFDAELVHEFTWFLMSALVLAIWYYGTKRITKVRDFGELL